MGTNKKTKTRDWMERAVLETMFMRPISQKELRALKGKKTKEEKEVIRLLDRWHKNANKKNFFIGDKKKNNPR